LAYIFGGLSLNTFNCAFCLITKDICLLYVGWDRGGGIVLFCEQGICFNVLLIENCYFKRGFCQNYCIFLPVTVILGVCYDGIDKPYGQNQFKAVYLEEGKTAHFTSH